MLTQNIESELSYAYLHAIAAKAGLSCKQGDRHDDGEGVDAELNYRGLTTHPYLRHVQLNIQLKATIGNGGKDPNFWSYNLQGINRFEKLRTNDSEIYKLLVVLFLPKNPSEWLKCTPDELLLKNSAFWTCLYGADPSANTTAQTVYLPKKNLLMPDELIKLVELSVHKRIPLYSKP